MSLKKLEEISIGLFEKINLRHDRDGSSCFNYKIDAQKLLEELNKITDYINKMQIEINVLKQVIFKKETI